MRAGPLSLGRPFGIRLRVDLSWFAVLALVGFATFTTYRQAYPLDGGVTTTVMALATTFLFVVSLLAHELAHAVLARRLGIPVRGITLFLFGGVSEISHEVPEPRDEFAIALVGPMVSVFLGGAFAAASVLAGRAGLQSLEGVTASLAGVNGILAMFNLVPGLPLDGGRLLRSGIWGLTGDRARSTRIAVVGGRLAALALLLWGAARVAGGDLFGLWFGFVALFLDASARASGRVRPGRGRVDRDEGSPAKSRSRGRGRGAEARPGGPRRARPEPGHGPGDPGQDARHP